MPRHATILIVDDEPEVRQILRQGLEAEGYYVVEAGSSSALLAALSATRVDLITLDLNLGQQDGLELAREIRRIRNVPIIMITGRGSPLDRVVGLEHGADDYIVKPFHIREVVIRIRTTLERYASALLPDTDEAARRYAFDGYVLDAGARELRSLIGGLVDLTETELHLVELFVRNPARVLSRDEIWQAVRGRDWSPLDRTLDGHIARLRRKIEAGEEQEPRMIKSVRGVGYVLAAEVRQLRPSTTPHAPLEAAVGPDGATTKAEGEIEVWQGP
ncbi:response regulator transcription factor [Alsobacter sp. R-9]